jgi:hypothetical protein
LVLQTTLPATGGAWRSASGGMQRRLKVMMILKMILMKILSVPCRLVCYFFPRKQFTFFSISQVARGGGRQCPLKVPNNRMMMIMMVLLVRMMLQDPVRSSFFKLFATLFFAFF